MAIYEGSGVAIVTPFTQTGEVNYDKLAELLEFHIGNHTDSIIICGTTGESSTMTHEEQLEVIRFTCERVAKRIPVIAGTGSNCTQKAAQLSKEAEQVGADGLLLVSPYYNKATQNGLKKHFTAIAAAVAIPVLLYNVPSRTGLNIAPATIADLVKHVKNIVGVKEASGNISAIASLMNLTDGNIDLYSGNDDQIVPLMSLGGKGVISVLANIAPSQTHDMVVSYLRGDIKKACRLQLDAIPVIEALFCEVNPIPVKAAMNLMGMEAGPLRLPLTEMEPQNQEKLKEAMKAYGIL